MKKILLLASLMMLCIAAAAQTKKHVSPPDSVIVNVEEYTINNVFSKCFKPCDKNGDGKVTVAEAAAADTLMLGYGGRKNIISDLSILNFFPNLKVLDPGNYTGEVLDISNMKHLEELNLRLAVFLKKIIIPTGCFPKIIYPAGEGEFIVERVRIVDPDNPMSWFD
ncbi:MAG: hypothetical protein IKX26_07550 [Bacteroidales bacterium]|nr:hypothetical protein [Bacteroidales bacterium]